KQLVTQWAPLIWISPEEKHFPTNVETFLRNVQVSDETGKLVISSINETHFPQFDSKSLFLVTKHSLESLRDEQSSFLYGHNPRQHSVPIYAMISPCTPYTSFRSSDFNSLRNDINALYGKTEPNRLFFSVTYWAFYPYNQGKKICFIGKVPTLTFFGTCFGHMKTIGSHVGDWEHISLSFRGKPFPSEMYLAVHDTGGYYRFDRHRRHFKFDSHRASKRVQKPKFPPIVRVQTEHPILFAADGSHGLWAAPGEHEYVKIPHLTDKCGYGIPWKTWENLKMFTLGSDDTPKWLYFKGKWGNPTTNCGLFKKFGLCEHTDGPPGILRNRQEFQC
ncbi:vacuolar protein sorting-associated protein 62, partial [Asbolus verrucosus]